jgi:hypothetical protein
MSSVISEEVVLKEWLKLNVYRINGDQVWMAEKLKDAMEGAAIAYGTTVQDISDELCPPKLLGTVASIAYSVEPTMLERALGRECMSLLRQGYIPPMMVGVLTV